MKMESVTIVLSCKYPLNIVQIKVGNVIRMGERKIIFLTRC